MLNSKEYEHGFGVTGALSNKREIVKASTMLKAWCELSKTAGYGKEGYLSAFMFSNEFREYFRETKSVKGYAGPTWSPYLWFDIDRKDDLQAAQRDTYKLASAFVERYQVSPDKILIFFSGAKGFHIGVPIELFSAEPSEVFHLCCRRFAERLAELAGVTIDSAIYDRVRLLRAPNSLHPKTKLHKVEVSFEMLEQWSIKAIQERAAEPQYYEVPDQPTSHPKAVSDWRVTVERAQAEAAEKTKLKTRTIKTPKLNKNTLLFMRGEFVPEEGERADTLYTCAANLAEFCCSKELAYELLTEPGLDSGLPPKEVKRQIYCGICVRDNGPLSFCNETIKGE